MNRLSQYFFILLFSIGQIISSVIGIQTKDVDNDIQIQADLFYLRNVDTSNIVDRILSRNWTENHDCLLELNAIKNGLKNHEEWAIEGILEIPKS